MTNETNQSAGSFRLFMKIYRGWRNFRDLFASCLDIDYARKVEIYTQLSTSATLKDVVYWLQILFSAGIATLGLVLNSSAVIIGAMLISPLMAPILSQGLSLATGDLALGVRALVNLFLSTLLGVAFAVVLVALLPFKDVTPEILARTEPNTLDLVIALFSGAIGSIATCRKEKGVVTSIPGVAIAVALMPPLCVIGFGLGYAISLGDWKGIEIAEGGGLLYLTNLVAITFTAMLVFVLLRIDTIKVREAVRDWREKDSESSWWLNQINKIPTLEKARAVRSFSLRLLMILLPLLIIFFPLSSSFSKLRAEITKKQAENRTLQIVRDVWKRYEIDSEGNTRSYLDDLQINETDDKLQIYLRVFDNVPYTPAERAQFINLVGSKLGRKPESISLQLIEIPTSAREDVSPIAKTTPTPATVEQRQAFYLQQINDALSGFRLPPPAILIGYDVTTRSSGATILEMSYLSERRIDDDGEVALREIVRSRLNLPDLGLRLTRVSQDVKSIPFEGPEGRLDTEKLQDLSLAAEELRRHPQLQLRVVLIGDENDNGASEKKKNAILEFFAKSREISEDRIIFSEETESGGSDRFQITVGK